ncbi:hypothetical protein L208DRAFT_1381404 [Tricholoma matsutake]|nr:hypothetical protein L208DRAFT_1381404 [Tricholoma matsutake 945]
MGKFFDEIPQFLIEWIVKQKMFWVASAPLSSTGFVNVSPKGVEGSFHLVSPTQVWFEDLTGSGVETIAHLRENGRITVLFSAFEGPPRIVRIFGKGHVYEFGTPEYEEFLPASKRKLGSRSVIMIDVLKVGSSCGYAVPFYTFEGQRSRLLEWSVTKELVDIEAESGHDVGECPPRPENGLKEYWMVDNAKSLNGLPGVLSAHGSVKPFKKNNTNFKRDGKRVRTRYEDIFDEYVDKRVVLGFVMGLKAK